MLSVSTVIGNMAYLATLLPANEVVAKWTTSEEAAKWAKLPSDFLTLFAKEMGEEEVPDLATMAAIDVADVRHVITNMKIPILKKTRLNLMLNSLRRKFGLELIDYIKAPEVMMSDKMAGEVNAAQTLAKVKENTGNSIRVAHVLDQASREEMDPLDEDTVNRCRQELHNRLEGEPLEIEEFSDSQLTAFKKRLDAGGSPACDYGVLGPFGRRVERMMSFRTVVKDQTGHERTIEVAGPATLDTWEACHQVFRSLALACKVCKLATLDNYKAKFRERCHEFPNQWALAMSADVVCRTEHWARLKSLHKRMYDDVNTRQFCAYDPAMPWDSAIAASTTDSEFWAKHFDRPALKAVADHRDGTPIHAQDQGNAEEVEASGKRRRVHEQGNRCGNRERDRPDAVRPDGRFYTDGGLRFCRAFHDNNNCRGPCKFSHNCEWCRKQHRSVNCWHAKQQKSNGKDSGGKAAGKGQRSSWSRAW